MIFHSRKGENLLFLDSFLAVIGNDRNDATVNVIFRTKHFLMTIWYSVLINTMINN